jgi:hypothetical protein
VIVPEFKAPTGRLPVRRDGLPLIGRVGPLCYLDYKWHLVRWTRATNSQGFCFFGNEEQLTLGQIMVQKTPLLFRKWGYRARCGSAHYGALKGLAYGLPTCQMCLRKLRPV